MRGLRRQAPQPPQAAVWVWKVKAITEELCGHPFSAPAISAINKTLDAELAALAGRRLEEAYPT